MDDPQHITTAKILARLQSLDANMWQAELDRIQEQFFAQHSPDCYVAFPQEFIRAQAAPDAPVGVTIMWGVAVPGWETRHERRGFAGAHIVDCFAHVLESVARDFAAAMNAGRAARQQVQSHVA